MKDSWEDGALAEIAGLKSYWSEKFEWTPSVRRDNDHIELYVRYVRRRDRSKKYVLRLRYQVDFRTAGRREAFVNPDDFTQDGLQFWPRGVRSLKLHENTPKPPMICLQGTWGFHSNLHRDRDGRQSSLNRLLMELQRCMDE